MASFFKKMEQLLEQADSATASLAGESVEPINQDKVSNFILKIINPHFPLFSLFLYFSDRSLTFCMMKSEKVKMLLNLQIILNRTQLMIVLKKTNY